MEVFLGRMVVVDIVDTYELLERREEAHVCVMEGQEGLI
jgi:hypothetical protein